MSYRLTGKNYVSTPPSAAHDAEGPMVWLSAADLATLDPRAVEAEGFEDAEGLLKSLVGGTVRAARKALGAGKSLVADPLAAGRRSARAILTSRLRAWKLASALSKQLGLHNTIMPFVDEAPSKTAYGIDKFCAQLRGAQGVQQYRVNLDPLRFDAVVNATKLRDGTFASSREATAIAPAPQAIALVECARQKLVCKVRPSAQVAFGTPGGQEGFQKNATEQVNLATKELRAASEALCQAWQRVTEGKRRLRAIATGPQPKGGWSADIQRRWQETSAEVNGLNEERKQRLQAYLQVYERLDLVFDMP